MSDPAVYYRLISSMGKRAMRKKAVEGETMHLAPLGWRNVAGREG